MLHGPWKEAASPNLVLKIDDPNVNSEAVTIALAYLYGHHPKLCDDNAFRVLAAASFLDLQDLCAICTDFIISTLWTENFLAYQVFAESQDYGIHGERVRNACWGYLCQSGTVELRDVLPKLSSQTLHTLLTSDELWVPNEEKRFELALLTLLSKGLFSEVDDFEQEVQISELEQSLKDNNLTYNTVKKLQPSSSTSNLNSNIEPYSFAENQNGNGTNRVSSCQFAMEGPSGDGYCYQITNGSRFSAIPLNKGVTHFDWERCSFPSTWGGRTVGRPKVKFTKFDPQSEEYDTFHHIFEGGSILYCNMSFDALLTIRKQLEELGFPCKTVNDGLWLQMLLYKRVQEIISDISKNCCLASCSCRQPYECSHGGTGDESLGISSPPRVHVRGPIDGLAGIGRGTTHHNGSNWLPTRYVFSRVPFGLGGRNCQQSLANDYIEARVDLNGDLLGDGLTAIAGLSQGSNGHAEHAERVYEADFRGRLSGSGTNVVPIPMMGLKEHAFGIDCESSGDSISLDHKTPLHDFPPFRFGVEFEEVHRLSDGQVKHSPEVFYAGSLWKVSVQAFSDEDPQGRRTLGLFLYRRKAEASDSLKKVHMYVDARERVAARYQLICPSKREVMVFGSFKQAGTLLPKAPKGWGWRTALLYDELGDLLQRGALRIAAIVQLV